MVYRYILCFFIVFSLLGCHLQTYPVANAAKGSGSAPSALGPKQLYRPLSPYKKQPPPKGLKLSETPSHVQSKVKSLQAQIKSKPESQKVRQKLIKLLYRSKLYELEIETGLPYLEELSKSSKLFLSKALQNRYLYEQQSKVLLSIVDSKKEDFRVFHSLGLAHYRLRNAELAVTYLRSSIEESNNYYPSYKTLLELFRETENNYESRELLKIMLHRFNERPEILDGLCELNFKDTYIEPGIKYCLKAYKKGKKDGQNLTYLGLLFKLSDDLSKAKSTLIKAARDFKKNEFSQWAAGQMYFDAKNYSAAKRYFLSGIAANPKKARNHLGLAASYFALNQFEPALAEYILSCSLNQGLTKTPFLVAASKVRMAKNYDWIKKYDRKSHQCRFSSPRQARPR